MHAYTHTHTHTTPHMNTQQHTEWCYTGRLLKGSVFVIRVTCRREIMFTNEHTHYTPTFHPVILEFVSQLKSKKPKIRLESYSFPIQWILIVMIDNLSGHHHYTHTHTHTHTPPPPPTDTHIHAFIHTYIHTRHTYTHNTTYEYPTTHWIMFTQVDSWEGPSLWFG